MIKGLTEAQKKSFILITLGNFFFFCNFASFFLLPLFIKHLGGDEAQIGFIMGSFGVTSMGTVPIVAPLIDMYGRKKFMAIGAALMFFASISFLFIHSMSGLFYLLRLLQGVGFACLFTSSGTAIVDVVPVEKRAQGLGIFGAFIISSYAVGPTIGEWIINSLGFDAFFPYASSFSLISLILVSLAKEPSFTPSGSSSYGLDFFRLFLLRRYTIPLFTNLVMGGGLGSILNFLPAFVKPKGLAISSFFLLYTITIAGIRFLGGKVSDILGRRKVIIPALFVFSLSVASVSLINSVFVLLSIAVIFGASYGILYPTLSALVMDRTDPGDRGKATGAFNICFSAGVNFFSFGFGVIARDLGFEAMYLTSAGLVMAGFLLFVFLER